MLSLLICVSVAGAEDLLVRPDKALNWKPPTFDNAKLHAQINFLKPQRQWERMDIWVPTEPDAGKLPCVVAVYGGGYGDKVGGFVKDFKPLLGRGYVVAAPDYALMTNAPVPMCSWDVANAIRFLRANAKKYRIDPERIGIWGWSAGGWIAQDLCYAGPERIVTVSVKDRQTNKKSYGLIPMLQPRPLYPDQSVKVQAVVSDWGAGKLWDRRTKLPKASLSPDDPPLFTCYRGELTGETVNAVTLLKKLGVPSEGVYGFTINTHVPTLKHPCVQEDGAKTTWGESIYDFLDRKLKKPDTATAPEIRPHGGFIAGKRQVRLLTVHPAGAIHYTLDGANPSEESPRYKDAITVTPGNRLKAIVVRPGLKPSRITTGVFAQGPPVPRITTTERTFKATIGKKFSITFQAENAKNAIWFVGGKVGEQYRSYDGQRFNPPRHIPWMKIDPKTGVMSGEPRTAGVFPVIVSCANGTVTGSRKPAKQTVDAVLIVITVEQGASK